MSENKPETSTTPADLFLEVLLGSADEGVMIPITITVGGLLISGDLIGEKEYAQSFMGGHFAERVRNVINETDSLKIAVEEAGKQPPPQKNTYTHINIKNARFHHPAAQSPIEGLNEVSSLWRGRLDSVDGYMLGKLEAMSEEKLNQRRNS